MRLIDCFSDALAYVLETLDRVQAGEQPSFDEVRLGVERRLAEHAADYAHGGYSRDQYLAAKFPVVVYIDEVLLHADWANRDQWARELLQKLHFNTANGGVEFFERLDGLSPFNPGERDIREVFYYCLALGFTGQFYRPGDRARLEEIRAANYRLLAEGQGRVADLAGVTLFPGARQAPVEGALAKPRRRRAALYYGVPVLILLAAFFVLRGQIVAAAEYLVTVL